MTALRIATFNVLYGRDDGGPGSWRQRLPLFRRAIEQARPDVLGLQEVLPSTLDDTIGVLGALAMILGPCRGRARWTLISTALDAVLTVARTGRPPDLAAVADARREIAESGELLPIAYRRDRFRRLDDGAFWISPTPEIPGSMLRLAHTPFLVHWARLEPLAGGPGLLVLNGHFGHAPWHHEATATTVTRQLETLERGSTTHTPVVLVGDFNAVPSSDLVRRLTRPDGPGFVDAAANAPERTGPPVSYHWGVGATRFGLHLDYVLAKGLCPLRAEVVDVHEGRLYPSDHHPLVVEFEAPGAGP